MAYVPQYPDQQVASVLSFVLFNFIKVELMQRQLIGELNTQPTTHHVSLLEITSQRNHIWSWKPKTVLTPDSILCFIISQWLGMLFMIHTHTTQPPCRRNRKETLRSRICHSVGFTMTSRVGQLGRKTWTEHRYFPSVLSGAVTWRWLFNQKFSKKLPRGLIIHRAQALFYVHNNSLARTSLHGTKERHNTATEASK